MNDFGIVILVMAVCVGCVTLGIVIKEHDIQTVCEKRGHYVINNTIALRCAVEKNYVLEASESLGERSE